MLQLTLCRLGKKKTLFPAVFRAFSAAPQPASTTPEIETFVAQITSDHTNRSGHQPFNLKDMGNNKQRPFQAWSFDEAIETLGPMVVPSYWQPDKPGVNLAECLVDCKKLGVASGDGLQSLFVQDGSDNKVSVDANSRLAQDLLTRMQDAYEKWGVVVLRNTQLTHPNGRGNALKLEAISKLLFNDEPEPYTAGSNLRGHLEPDTNVYDTGAPSTAHLHYHHEMQYVNRSPKSISFLALAVPKLPTTGPTYVSYNPGATRDLLSTATGQKLAERRACYVRKLPDLAHFQRHESHLDPRMVYNFWQTSMDTDDPAAAEAIARGQGLEVSWEDSPVFGRYMVTRFYIDAFEYDEKVGSNQLFCSVADDWMWFDTWQGLSDLAPEHRPLALEYGDGTQLSPEDKRVLTQVYDNHGVPVSWDKPGDMALVCNRRTAHGRPAYDLPAGEERDLGVVLGARFLRKGQKEGKWGGL